MSEIMITKLSLIKSIYIHCVSKKTGTKEMSQNCFSTAILRTFNLFILIASYKYIKKAKNEWSNFIQG